MSAAKRWDAVFVRLTTREAQLIRREARKMGLSAAAYMRVVVIAALERERASARS